MTTLSVFDVEVPWDIDTLEGFRRWVATLDEHAPRVHYSPGMVHLEMPQNYRDHGPVAEAINKVLLVLADELDLGQYHAPPSWITHAETRLSTEPDGFLLLWESLASGRVRINPQRETELLGRPDMALEVVSRSSAKKDLVKLVENYAAAGVREYWIADPRGAEVVFRILVLQADGTYGDQPVGSGGWIASPLWHRSFRLTYYVDRLGTPTPRLEVGPGA